MVHALWMYKRCKRLPLLLDLSPCALFSAGICPQLYRAVFWQDLPAALSCCFLAGFARSSIVLFSGRHLPAALSCTSTSPAAPSSQQELLPTRATTTMYFVGCRTTSPPASSRTTTRRLTHSSRPNLQVSALTRVTGK